MLQKGNYEHRRIISNFVSVDTEMDRWMRTRSRPQISIPPECLYVSNGLYHSDTDDDDDEMYVIDPTTSGRIYLKDAATAFYRFASKASATSNVHRLHPNTGLFNFREERSQHVKRPRTYVCSITLPGTVTDGIHGSSTVSMALARRAACFNACRKLSDAGALDSQFFFLGFVPSTVSDSSIFSSKEALPPPQSERFLGTRAYTKQRPQFWASGKNFALTPLPFLFPTIVTVNHGTLLPHAPIIILTRRALPDLSSFRVFYSGMPAMVCLTKGQPFEIDADRLHALHLYTLRLCRTIANRPLTCELTDMPYFLAPLPLNWTFSDEDTYPIVRDHISWDIVRTAGEKWAVPLVFGFAVQVENDVEDAMIQDRWTEFTRRYIVTRTRSDLNPLSKTKGDTVSAHELSHVRPMNNFAARNEV